MNSISGTTARRADGLIYMIAIGSAVLLATANTGRLSALGVPVLILAAATLRYPGHSSFGTATMALIIVAYAVGAVRSQNTDYTQAMAMVTALGTAHLAQWLLQLVSGASAVAGDTLTVPLRMGLRMALAACVAAMLAFVASTTRLADAGGFGTSVLMLLVVLGCAYFVLPKTSDASRLDLRDLR